MVVLVFAGCPRGQQSVLGQVPDGGNPEARKRFGEARARFEQAGVDVTPELSVLVKEYPKDPVVPYALLLSGMSSVRAAKYDVALKHLTELEKIPSLDPQVAARGKLYQGISLNYLSRHADAISALRAAEGSVNRDDAEEYGQWLSALAVAHQKTGRPDVAIRYFDAWYGIATTAEKAFVAAQVRAIADGLAENAVEPAYRSLENRDGPGAAYLGTRLAAVYTARGQLDKAAEIREQIAGARQSLGEAPDVDASGEGDRRKLGAILPLSGRKNRLGERSMRGITLGANVFGPEGDERFAVAVRDAVQGAGPSTQAIEQLADENVIAVVGPMDADSVEAAGRRAGQRGIPLVSLSPRGSVRTQSSRFVFHVVHSAEARARALARYAVAKKIKDFAILAPSSAYGRAVAGAFADEVDRQGGRVVVRAWYPENATSFGTPINELKKPWRAIFIPDQARRLSLVAPALAAANFVARPIDEPPSRSGPRKIVVLSTAELADDSFVRSTGRYTLGGILAPGFYPDRKDDVIGRFVASYQEQFGTTPTALEAYAFDAVAAIGHVIRQGAQNRDEVAARLASASVSGLTGTIGFASNHDRRDDGLLYRVEQLTSGEFELRALRP